MLSEIFRTETCEYWIELLERHDIPVCRVNRLEDILDHPQIAANGLIVEHEDPVRGRLRTLGPLIKMFGDANRLHRAGPGPGRAHRSGARGRRPVGGRDRGAARRAGNLGVAQERGAVLVRAAFALLAAAALVPFASDLDAHLDWALEAWRTCRGLSIADRVSDLVQPVGVTVLVLATGRALWRRRSAREVLGILASLAVGTLLIGALKDVFDRPRRARSSSRPAVGASRAGTSATRS